MDAGLQSMLAELIRAKLDVDNASAYCGTLYGPEHTQEERTAAHEVWESALRRLAARAGGVCLASASYMELAEVAS